jgi:RNA polymerase sigma-70 factor (ECF subfamily)
MLSKEDAAKQSAFLALLDEHYDPLLRYVRAMTRNVEDARDIVGETLLRAYESFDTLRDPASFLFYLITIAKRLHWRASKRKAFHIPFERKHEDLHIDTAASTELSPDIDALNRAIEQLSPRLREALVLFELSGLSLKEIRKVQGGTLSGVKSRVARARKQLAHMLGERSGAVQAAADEACSETVKLEAER